ncbi:13E12 repeat family protein [Tessaracoccus sp. Z1128]
MEDTAREVAEQLRSVDELRRFAEAQTLTLLCDLADHYEVGYDQVVEVLAERRIAVGGVGTPAVSEFIALELAGVLRCTPTAAASKLADALNLKHRHPGLFQAVQEARVEPSRACRAASMCVDLPAEAADAVTDLWVGRQVRLGWTAAFNLLKKMIIEADPAVAAERERRQRASRGVHVWGLFDGVMNLTGRLDVIDARYLDAAVDRIADLLATEHPDTSKTILRAKALGVLANPAYALALLQQAAQPALLESVSAALDGGVPAAPAAAVHGGQRHDPHCLGALCGTITTPLAKLRPRLELAVHIHTDAAGQLTGPARIDRAGHITTALLAELLPGLQVSVQPVIDLAEVPAEDGYTPSVGLKKALMLTMDHEMFPYSKRRAAGLDLDHTQPFAPGCRGQTRIGNLAPLSRRVHRAKTARAWRVDQPRPGQFYWFSPLGYRYEVTPSGTRMLD